MQPAKVSGAFVMIGALLGAIPAQGQTTVGADLGLLSSYVWRGLSLTNKPVAEPDLYVTIPAGGASFTAGGWANIDLGKYDDPVNDISESGGTSSFNFAEFDWWGEVSYPVGKATLTGGVTGYIYPNDFGLTKANNTVEIYAKAAFDAPLSPKLSIYYDVDKIDGAYIEGAVTHSLAASEKVSVNLGALAGFSAGQNCNGDILLGTCTNGYNFQDNGLTHIDLSAAVPFSAGAISLTPALHVVVAVDEATKIASPTKVNRDVKLWGGVTISWSKALGEAPAEPAE